MTCKQDAIWIYGSSANSLTLNYSRIRYIILCAWPLCQFYYTMCRYLTKKNRSILQVSHTARSIHKTNARFTNLYMVNVQSIIIKYIKLIEQNINIFTLRSLIVWISRMHICAVFIAPRVVCLVYIPPHVLSNNYWWCTQKLNCTIYWTWLIHTRACVHNKNIKNIDLRGYFIYFIGAYKRDEPWPLDGCL